MEEIIKVTDLEKSFKDIKALQGISFKVKQGELFAFLGINGAGKSTTIAIMSGRLKKDSGKVFINGIDLDSNSIDSIKSTIGIVFQNSLLDKVLTVEDNLKIRASLYGIIGNSFTEKLNELDKMLDLKPLLKRTVNKLSGGQRRKVDIARALLNSPTILILDEPTTGLDPQTRKTIWEVIDHLRETQNMTVFLTTHYMEEASTANYVVILDGGKIVAHGTPLDLKNTYTGDFIFIYNTDEKIIKKLKLPYEKVNNGFRVKINNTSDATNLIKTYPEVFVDYEILKGKMDDVFLATTGHTLVRNEK